MLGLQALHQVQHLRAGSRRRAPTPARRPRSASGSAPARGPARCAGAGRRRTRAGSARAASGGSPTSSSSSADALGLLARACPTRWIESGSRSDRADPHPRVERGVRILEHQLQVAPRPRAAAPVSALDVLAVEQDRGRPSGCSSADDQPAERRLAAARTRRPARTSRPRRTSSDTSGDRLDRRRPCAAGRPARVESLRTAVEHERGVGLEQPRADAAGAPTATAARSATRPVGPSGGGWKQAYGCAVVLAAQRRLLVPGTRRSRTRQRGANRQPAGGSDRSGGRPGIVYSGWPRSWSSRGIEPSSASV